MISYFPSQARLVFQWCPVMIPEHPSLHLIYLLLNMCDLKNKLRLDRDELSWQLRISLSWECKTKLLAWSGRYQITNWFKFNFFKIFVYICMFQSIHPLIDVQCPLVGQSTPPSQRVTPVMSTRTCQSTTRRSPAPMVTGSIRIMDINPPLLQMWVFFCHFLHVP